MPCNDTVFLQKKMEHNSSCNVEGECACVCCVGRAAIGVV